MGYACGDALIGRFGEEFVAALPGRDLAAATEAAEQLRAEVAGLSFEDAQETLRVTVTVGVATVRLDEVELAPAIGRADAALYQAKNAGRNRVCVAPEA